MFRRPMWRNSSNTSAAVHSLWIGFGLGTRCGSDSAQTLVRNWSWYRFGWCWWERWCVHNQQTNMWTRADKTVDDGTDQLWLSIRRSSVQWYHLFGDRTRLQAYYQRQFRIRRRGWSEDVVTRTITNRCTRCMETSNGRRFETFTPAAASCRDRLLSDRSTLI